MQPLVFLHVSEVCAILSAVQANKITSKWIPSAQVHYTCSKQPEVVLPPGSCNIYAEFTWMEKEGESLFGPLVSSLRRSYYAQYSLLPSIPLPYLLPASVAICFIHVHAACTVRFLAFGSVGTRILLSIIYFILLTYTEQHSACNSWFTTSDFRNRSSPLVRNLPLSLCTFFGSYAAFLPHLLFIVNNKGRPLPWSSQRAPVFLIRNLRISATCLTLHGFASS